MKAFNKSVCLYAAPRLLFMLQLPLQKTTYNKVNLIIFHCMREQIMDDESIGAVFPNMLQNYTHRQMETCLMQD